MLLYTFNQMLNYVRNIGDHNIDVLIGHEYASYNYKRLGGSKTGFAGIPGNTEFDSASTPVNVYGNLDSRNLESYL